jgi:hypothetical protein
LIDCTFLSFTSRSSSRPGPAPGGAEGLLACARRRSKAARCHLLPVEEGDGIPQRLIDCQRLLREALLRLCISGEFQPKYKVGLTERTNGRMSLFSPDFEPKNDSTLPRWAGRPPVSGSGDGEKWDAAENEEDPRAALGGNGGVLCRCRCDVTLREPLRVELGQVP